MAQDNTYPQHVAKGKSCSEQVAKNHHYPQYHVANDIKCHVAKDNRYPKHVAKGNSCPHHVAKDNSYLQHNYILE